MSPKKKISIVTPCYNEEDNVAALVEAVRNVMSTVPRYDYEHIFVDNASTDNTVEILRGIAATDEKVKAVVNLRNYGQSCSPYNAYMQVDGDALITLVADFQDPPELILRFLEKWEEGFKIVAGVKNKSLENPWVFLGRRLYYFLMKISCETPQIPSFTGFGLYDKEVLECLRRFHEPVPYFRGLVTELGFPIAQVNYVQPKRERGRSTNNFFTLYDVAMTGFVNYSRLPLRLAVFMGFLTALFSFGVALFYLIMKLCYWDTFFFGLAPIMIGMFFLGAIQLIFLGIIGEYIGAILVRLKNRPHVIEKERINWPKEPVE